MTIEPREVALLVLRLELHLEPYGLRLDKKRFESMLRQDNGERRVLSDVSSQGPEYSSLHTHASCCVHAHVYTCIHVCLHIHLCTCLHL